MHFLKAYDDSYAKMNKEHEYKDEYKDNDRDVERLTESLTVYTSWIRWRLIKPTPPQPSTARCSLIPVQPSTAKYSQYPNLTRNPNFLVKPDPNPTWSQKALLVIACSRPSCPKDLQTLPLPFMTSMAHWYWWNLKKVAWMANLQMNKVNWGLLMWKALWDFAVFVITWNGGVVRVLGGKVAGLGQTRQGLGGHKGAGAGQASSSRGPGPVQGGRAPGHQATLSSTTVRPQVCPSRK